jgi:hypothetical protein
VGTPRARLSDQTRSEQEKPKAKPKENSASTRKKNKLLEKNEQLDNFQD